jgi:hypothetical protein
MRAMEGYSGTTDLVVPLIVRAMRDGDRSVRRQAIVAVQRMKLRQPEIREALRSVVANDPDADIRALTAVVLKTFDG